MCPLKATLQYNYFQQQNQVSYTAVVQYIMYYCWICSHLRILEANSSSFKLSILCSKHFDHFDGKNWHNFPLSFYLKFQNVNNECYIFNLSSIVLKWRLEIQPFKDTVTYFTNIQRLYAKVQIPNYRINSKFKNNVFNWTLFNEKTVSQDFILKLRFFIMTS